MPVYKMIPPLIIGGLLLAVGVFWFAPGLRPGFVQRWFDSASGFTPATSPEDALDKFRKAIEKRRYDDARKYLTGDYLGSYEVGMKDASALATEIDNLRSIMSSTGTKTPKVDMVLYWLDPFPAFKYEIVKKGEKEAQATLNWNDDAGKFADAKGYNVTFDNGLKHSLLPIGVLVPSPLPVTVRQIDGNWKIVIPAELGDRKMTFCTQALDKHASNVVNSLRTVSGDLKREPSAKADFENTFQSALHKAVK
jgi:hypothetical protein